MILNGFLAMARSALVNVRKARLRQLIEEGVALGAHGRAAGRGCQPPAGDDAIGHDADQLFRRGRGGRLSRRRPWPDGLEPWLGAASYPVAFVLVVLLAAIVMLIFGELVPETIALQHSERLALLLARPLAVISVLAMPVVHLMVWLSNGISRLFGVRSAGDMPFVTEEEIKTLVDAGEEEGVIQEEEKEMIYSIFELGDTLAREVMVPRIDVVALDVTTPMLEALETIMEAGHSRIPVYRGDDRQRAGRALCQGPAALSARGPDRRAAAAASCARPTLSPRRKRPATCCPTCNSAGCTWPSSWTNMAAWPAW